MERGRRRAAATGAADRRNARALPTRSYFTESTRNDAARSGEGSFAALCPTLSKIEVVLLRFVPRLHQPRRFACAGVFPGAWRRRRDEEDGRREEREGDERDHESGRNVVSAHRQSLRSTLRHRDRFARVTQVPDQSNLRAENNSEVDEDAHVRAVGSSLSTSSTRVRSDGNARKRRYVTSSRRGFARPSPLRRPSRPDATTAAFSLHP